MSEEWRTIAQFPDYSVSSAGRIMRSLPDRHGRGCGAIIKPVLGNHGYFVVSLHRDAKQSVRLIHRIVCEAFHGPAPYGAQAAHGDGDRSNNRPGNLRWATPSSNNLDKNQHGTMRCGPLHHSRAAPERMPRGERHGNAKLTDQLVKSIRSDTRPQSKIAAECGVSQSLVSKVKTKAIWAHIEE